MITKIERYKVMLSPMFETANIKTCRYCYKPQHENKLITLRMVGTTLTIKVCESCLIKHFQLDKYTSHSWRCQVCRTIRVCSDCKSNLIKIDYKGQPTNNSQYGVIVEKDSTIRSGDLKCVKDKVVKEKVMIDLRFEGELMDVKVLSNGWKSATLKFSLSDTKTLYRKISFKDDTSAGFVNGNYVKGEGFVSTYIWKDKSHWKIVATSISKLS